MKWNYEAMAHGIGLLNTGSLDEVEKYYPDVVDLIGGCLRGLFISKPGHDIICSDFSAIEAVVMAEVAGETWRQEVFRTHGKIYEMSASKITGVPFEEILAHKEKTGQHHPYRKKVGKVAELASGFGGWIGAWDRFGARDFFKSDDDLKAAILKWRDDSPMIVKFWKEVERCFTQSIMNPQQRYEYRGIKFGMLQNCLFVQLPSGRKLTYHEPQIHRRIDEYGREKIDFSYMQWNSTYQRWERFYAWYGVIVENIIQSIARDILANSLINLNLSGYPVIFHTHDEAGAEVPERWGSVEEFERIGSIMPSWAAGWPVKMKGGWRGKRYRKE